MAAGFELKQQEGMSYNAFQKLLKKFLKKIRQKRYPNHVFRYKKTLQNENTIQKQEHQTKELINYLEEIESTKTEENNNIEKEGNIECKLELITMLKQFLERKHILQHIESTIPDRRNQELITYSKQTIIICALSIFLFRMASGNKYDDKFHDADEKYCITNMSKFIDAPEDRVPVIKTIETFLKNLTETSVNNLMIAFFKDLQKSKFFKQHPQIMPGDFFLLAADCVHTHTYDHFHHKDAHGNNDCPCCLKRVYNKGTAKEITKWMHITLVFSFVFTGGLKLPIYRYPIHARQVPDLETASEEIHKQECELVALKVALPFLREAFPKMKIVLLLDGLYANRPVIRLAEAHRSGYIIVKKDGCLPTLSKECDEIAKHTNHKKNCTKTSQFTFKNWKIEHRYEWFNSQYLGEGLNTNVLRFWEVRTKDYEDSKTYKCEWLFSWRLSAKTCELAARNARARWEIEDLFNTLKNRGYNFKHDYSRNPRSCFNWHAIALFAFGIFELFRFSEAVKSRGDLPQITIVEKLQGQLIHRPTEEIFSNRCLSKIIQFRYIFFNEPLPKNELDFIGRGIPFTDGELKTG